MLSDYKVKGRLNKIKIGQKVKARQRLVDWYSSHLVWGFGHPVNDDPSYVSGEKEIRNESLARVYSWTLAKLSGKMPTGIVTHYGADGDWDDKKKENIRGRKCVWVEFTFKTELGDLNYGSYVSEKDLEAIKNKKR